MLEGRDDGFRGMAPSGVSWERMRGLEGKRRGGTTGEGKIKAPARSTLKPLTWLGFLPAWRAVAGMLPGFWQ
jgi:hypothetical protein